MIGSSSLSCFVSPTSGREVCNAVQNNSPMITVAVIVGFLLAVAAVGYFVHVVYANAKRSLG